LRVGILGGTFDPVHIGHLILAHCAAEQLKLDQVRFIPTGDPWRKASRQVTPAQHRLEMTRLATAGDKRFTVDDCEVRREGPTYTTETLQALKLELGPGTELYFLIGEDALDDMPYWHKPEVIFEVAHLAVAPRMDTPVAPAPQGHADKLLALPPYERIDMPYIGISSTDLRARVQRGGSLHYLVPDAVGRYISEQRLYR
jgi:nicotinate-nucleotide adenylyltransferase